MNLDPRAQPTPDRWSMEQYVTVNGKTIFFKPYRVFTLFAVIIRKEGKDMVVYDGGSEQKAIQIFNQHCSK